MKLSYWQFLSLLFVLLKLQAVLRISWWEALAPLGIHLLIRLEMQVRQMRHGKRLPWCWFLE